MACGLMLVSFCLWKSSSFFATFRKSFLGPNTFPMISSLVDDVITVTDEQVARAWCDVMQRMKAGLSNTENFDRI